MAFRLPHSGGMGGKYDVEVEGVPVVLAIEVREVGEGGYGNQRTNAAF